MATTAKIARNEHRKAVVARYAQRRGELKALIARPGTPDADRLAAQQELQRQPRDASAGRIRNRDAVDGRPRGYLRAFGVSRIRMRSLAHGGYLPGVTKSSW
ncbi:30S ribosomal protein S14 [Pseudonocardia sp. GCM10023141]|uniref:30S ribosomal protein S14 n=1 Tax=Pseudonocardia sp. GCM10023141 TaxID=3252653 RepID=UPI00361B33EA